MQRSRRFLAIGALSAALVSLIAYAAQPPAQRNPRVEAPPPVAAAVATPQAGTMPASAIPRPSRPDLKALRAPVQADVGDLDSFGRPLRWLGATQGNITLTEDDCALPEYAGLSCQQMAPAPAATGFSFQDLGHITLPGKSAHSLLCYWFSPVLSLAYWNPGMEPATAVLNYGPTLTIESEVLNDPALIDAASGEPFNGKLTVGMTSSEYVQTPLRANEALLERTRDSAVCMAGFLTRRALVEDHGLTRAQAKKVFQKPMTIRLNVSGSASYLPEASLIFGLRIVGD
ncbi:MAG: hypothetical protein L0H23_08540 [Luteimonas sp.]|nr:hypothetical protein [Luteimonas sp.]